MLVFGTWGCQSNSSEKLKEAKAESAEADENLNQAKEEYQADLENYKLEVKSKITTNEQSINEFKARIANSKIEAKADYDRRINVLEKKNTDMQRKMDEYKMESAEQWKSFKAEFNHDMDEIGKALKDLTISNTN